MKVVVLFFLFSEILVAQSWYVLAGSFQTACEAEKFCKYLIDAGYPAYVLYDNSFQVRIGPYDELSEANLNKENLIADKKISAVVIQEEDLAGQRDDFLPGVEVSRDTLSVYHNEMAKKIIQLSIELFGHPYRYGGSIVGQGIDCSYYVQRIFKELSVSLPRSSIEQFKVGRSVDIADLRVGDLVFFKKTYYRRVKKRKIPYTRINHVGIYIGRGEFIHATVNVKKVTISKLSEPYYARRYAGARRVL